MGRRIMHATPHTSTSLSPATLLFGEWVDVDQGIFTDYMVPQGEDSHPTKTAKNIDLHRWIAYLLCCSKSSTTTHHIAKAR